MVLSPQPSYNVSDKEREPQVRECGNAFFKDEKDQSIT